MTVTGKTTPKPVLWHLAMSHYSEKVRWALDFKQLPHTRRAVMPPFHAVMAGRMTGKGTFPVMTVGGRTYGDSTEIIAALEELAPEPALYPIGPGERQRALELEEIFDTGVGRTVRQVGYRSILADPDVAVPMLATGGPPSRRLAVGAIFPGLAPAMRKHFRVPGPDDEKPLDLLREQVRFIGSEVGPSGFLVGDSFSVADLTAAALLAPALCPEAMPAGLPPFPRVLREVARELCRMPGGDWARQVYLEYR